MIKAGEQELICDLAETYHIFDYRSLPVSLVATLCAGLGDNSRIIKKLRGEKYPRDLVILAAIADRLAILHASICGIKEKPPLFTEAMFPDESAENAQVFESIDAFRAEYDRLTREESK